MQGSAISRSAPAGARLGAILQDFTEVTALAKCALGIASFFLSLLNAYPSSREFLFFTLVLVFAGTGVALTRLSAREERATTLGILFFLVAAAFSEPLMEVARANGSISGGLLGAALSLEPEAFLPYFWFRFVRAFPEPDSREEYSWVDRVEFVYALLGGVLFVINVLPIVLTDPALPAAIALFIEPDDPTRSLFWSTLFVAGLPTLIYAAWKTWMASTAQLRRIRTFVWGMVMGLAPIVIDTILEDSFPRFGAFMQQHRSTGGILVYPALLSVPLTTAYSVSVHRVLTGRLLVRNVVMYFLARYSMLALTVFPFGLVLGYAYRRRAEPLDVLLTSRSILGILAVAAVGGIAYRFRENLMLAIDRRFFREQYNSHQILTNLVGRLSSSSIEEVPALVTEEISKALHPASVAVFVAGRSGFRSAGTGLPMLSAESEIIRSVASSRRPLNTDPEDPASIFNMLPTPEKEWIVDAGSKLVVPVTFEGVPKALIALGSKKSDLPYVAGDVELLTAIASTLTIILERGIGLQLDSIPDAQPEMAKSCPRCHAIFAGRDECTACGDTGHAIGLPKRIHDKLELERVLGRGGMGVVYLASDLALPRKLAVKTLPSVSLREIVRLRREAETMAGLSHPNLAIILSIESWRGVPLLLFEYLEGGTLSDRIGRRQLSTREAAAMASELLGALAYLHEQPRPVLHRDIKPSNIAFTRDGWPKLLDFGIAALLHTSVLPQAATSAQTGLADPSTAETIKTMGRSRTDALVGTPAYLPPEALRRESPKAQFDLWSMALTLYEAVSGCNPMLQGTLYDTLEKVRLGVVPDVREFEPGCDPAFAQFLNTCLAKEARSRPATAREMLNLLNQTKEKLVTARS
jgi:hypothetical protein